MLYVTQKLSMRETKYSTIKEECMAIKWVVLTLQYYWGTLSPSVPITPRSNGSIT